MIGMTAPKAVLCGAVLLMLTACGGGGGGDAVTPTPAPMAFDFQTPQGFPEPRVAGGVTVTPETVALGRQLFYDNRISVNGQASCGTCHEQRKAFTDGRTTSIGATGEAHPRNAMSLANAVYNARQNWANPLLRDLRQQALAVLFAETPVELGWAGREAEILARLRDDADTRAAFAAAFPNDADPVSVANVADALAAFVAALLSGNAPRDRYYHLVNPDREAMSASARRGETLFFSERLECFHCHGGFNFAQSVTHEGAVIDSIEYRNTGLYNIPGPGNGYPLEAGNYPPNNQGLYEFTGVPSDMGRFRAPTLRNIALTAPYMHDGSIATLREVIVDHYAQGGRTIATGPLAGNGAASPYRDVLMVGFTLTEAELSDLLAFFDSLTDWGFICDERFSDPFGRIPMHEHCTNLTSP